MKAVILKHEIFIAYLHNVTWFTLGFREGAGAMRIRLSSALRRSLVCTWLVVCDPALAVGSGLCGGRSSTFLDYWLRSGVLQLEVCRWSGSDACGDGSGRVPFRRLGPFPEGAPPDAGSSCQSSCYFGLQHEASLKIKIIRHVKKRCFRTSQKT